MRLSKRLRASSQDDYFYSPDNGRWIDFVVWSDVKLAKKASEAAMNDPKAGAVLSTIDR